MALGFKSEDLWAPAQVSDVRFFLIGVEVGSEAFAARGAVKPDPSPSTQFVWNVCNVGSSAGPYGLTRFLGSGKVSDGSFRADKALLYINRSISININKYVNR